MSFYLKPPRGLINFHTLESCVEERLTCYNSLYDENVIINNIQCLIEDSALDRCGHFVFRLAAFSSYSFSQIFIKAEQKLFQRRLNCYAQEDIKYFLKSLLRQAKQCSRAKGLGAELHSFYDLLQDVCKKSLQNDFSNHVYGLFHLETEYCELYHLKVPFTVCPSLVSSRLVELEKGFAIIKCKIWKEFLSSLFTTYLRLVLKEMKYSKNVLSTLNDERIKECLKHIRKHYFHKVGYEKSSFDLARLDEESKHFPLCMTNLLNILRKNHRLSHESRYEFSTYMKGIGLSMSDAIQFWEEEYSKEHGSCSKCTHSLQKNERKYLYSIRHMYGLEGSRKCYSMRSCSYLQEKILSATDEGGCPFKHFDDESLRKLMRKNFPEDNEEIEVIIYERKQNPNASCKLFYKLSLKTLHNIEPEKNVLFTNPVEYYKSFKNHLK